MRRSRRAEVEPLTAELRRVHLTTDRELLELLAQARDALSRSHPGASDDAVIKVGLRLIVERHRKRRGIGAKPRVKRADATAPVTADPPPPPKRSRHVPAEVVVDRYTSEGRGSRGSEPVALGRSLRAALEKEYPRGAGSAGDWCGAFDPGGSGSASR